MTPNGAKRLAALPALWLIAVSLHLGGCAQSMEMARPAPPPAPAFPELVLQSGHHSMMNDVAFTPDGRWLISGNQDTTLKLWDFRTGREMRTFSGHRGMVWRLDVSPDGRMLASASNDGTAKLWDIDTGRELRTLVHRGGVWTVAFSPDGGLLASGSADHQIRVWDVPSGRPRSTLLEADEVNRVVFVNGGAWIAAGAGTKVNLWDVRAGRKLRTLGEHGDHVLSLSVSRDGRWLASGSEDGEITLWDTAAGWQARTVSPRVGTHHGIYSIAFSPDGRLLAAETVEAVRVWEIATGREVWVSEADSAIGSMSVAFSPDGRWLATAAHHSLKIRETDRWRVQSVLGSEVPESVNVVAVSRNGRILAAGSSDRAVRLWDLASGGQVRTMRGHVGEITALAFSPDNRLVVSSADTIAPSSTETDHVIRIWSAQDGQLLRELAGHTDGVPTLSFSPTGELLASGGKDKTVRLWDPTTGREVHTLSGHRGVVNVVAFSPDGRVVASGGGRVDWKKWQGDDHPIDKTIKLWDAAAGREIRTLTGSSGEIVSLAFSPDGRWLASGAGPIRHSERGGDPYDNVIRLWDAATGSVARELQTAQHAYQFTSGWNVAFNRDGSLLAAASGIVQLWEMPSGRQVRILRPPTPAVGARFSPDGRWVLTIGGDGAVRVWDVRTGEMVATLVSLTRGNEWLAVSPDGLFDGSPRAWKRILWRFGERTPDLAPVEVFFREFYRPGLLADILAGRGPRATRDFTRLDRRQPQIDLGVEGGSPGAATSVGSRYVTVRVTVAEAPPNGTHDTGSGARDVRLFRNGSLVKIWHGDVLGDRPRVTLETSIAAVAGEQHLAAYAFNRDNVKSEDAGLALEGADALRRPATAYILAAGINRYANPSFNLRYAVPDARAFAEALGFHQRRIGVYDDIRVVLLEDREATKASLLGAFARLAGAGSVPAPNAPAEHEKLARAEPEDAVFIYFAGHGVARDRHFYLVPHDLGYSGRRADADEAALREIEAHGVSEVEISSAFEGIDAGRLILVIDACESGQVLESEEARQGPLNSRGLAQLAYDKGMDVLTAAQGYQAALESTRLGHGLLTYALVEEALKTDLADTDPTDGVVTGREWLDYAVRRVPELQLEMMEDARKAGRDVSVVEGEAGAKDVEERTLQRPRVFYRRDSEVEPFPVAKP